MSSGFDGTTHKWGFELTIMDTENLNISLQLFSYSYEFGIAVEHLTTSPCCSSIFVICLSYEFSCIFPLVYELGRGVRIFKNIAGVRIRTLVYEKKTLLE